jgi:hypothetical protein
MLFKTAVHNVRRGGKARNGFRLLLFAQNRLILHGLATPFLILLNFITAGPY